LVWLLRVGEISDPAVWGAAIAAIISTWFFAKTCRKLSQEYFSKKEKNKPLSLAEYLTAIEQWEDGE
jgi:hypothetical protein